MQMCPNCDSLYDESEYCHCPYCSGELEHDEDQRREGGEGLYAHGGEHGHQLLVQFRLA